MHWTQLIDEINDANKKSAVALEIPSIYRAYSKDAKSRIFVHHRLSDRDAPSITVGLRDESKHADVCCAEKVNIVSFMIPEHVAQQIDFAVRPKKKIKTRQMIGRRLIEAVIQNGVTGEKLLKMKLSDWHKLLEADVASMSIAPDAQEKEIRAILRGFFEPLSRIETCKDHIRGLTSKLHVSKHGMVISSEEEIGLFIHEHVNQYPWSITFDWGLVRITRKKLFEPLTMHLKFLFAAFFPLIASAIFPVGLMDMTMGSAKDGNNLLGIAGWYCEDNVVVYVLNEVANFRKGVEDLEFAVKKLTDCLNAENSWGETPMQVVEANRKRAKDSHKLEKCKTIVRLLGHAEEKTVAFVSQAREQIL
jgi:hypothetical protein